jgi:capsular polysaccharide transport system permease protein
MMERLDAELTLADHWSQWWIDPLTKLTFANSPEDLYAYYLKRVKVEYDEYAGVLVIQSEGFDPETAQAMTAAMVADGESFMNGMAQSLAERQVSFLQNEVDSLAERAIQARQAVIAYQNQEGLVSPQIAAETITATISRLQARKTEMQIQLATLSSYLVADHPSIVELRQQIEAVDEQIALENARLIGGGDQLNTQVEQFGRLQMEAEFATAVHQTALAALERGRVESTRTIKSMSVIQPPTMPHEAGSPARLYNALVQAIFAFLIAGVIQLLIAIIREHKD